MTNHLGYVDLVVLASELDAVFVAKSEVARWPVIGRLTRSMGTLFVDRRTPRGIPAIVTAIDEALAGGREPGASRRLLVG